MKKFFTAAVFAGLLAMAHGNGFCAGEEFPLFWPPPPDDMRIVFVKSIYSPKEAGIKPAFFKKLKTFITGEKNDLLSLPTAVAADSQGAIYICDTGTASVYQYRPKEKRFTKISSINGQPLVSPVGVAVNHNGQVFIADSRLKKIFCLDKNGRFQWAVGGEGSLLRPTGLAADDNKLYAVDTAAHRVLQFNFKGELIAQFGQRGKGDGEFNFPTSIALDKEGRMYVVDTLNFRIQIFNREGRFLSAIGQIGDSSGSFSRPKGVAIDSFGHIYSTDGLSDNIQIFNREKEFLLSLGESGHNNGEFWIVSGIAIDDNDYIYVADSYNRRLQVFRYVGKD